MTKREAKRKMDKAMKSLGLAIDEVRRATLDLIIYTERDEKKEKKNT